MDQQYGRDGTVFGFGGRRKSRSHKAGLYFPVRKVYTQLRNGKLNVICLFVVLECQNVMIKFKGMNLARICKKFGKLWNIK